jgi:hypothetical protein
VRDQHNQKSVNAKAVEAKIGSSSTGKPEICIIFQNVDGAKKHRYDGYLTEDAAEFTMQNLRTCGWQGDNLIELDGCNCNEMLPAEVELVLQEEEYEGNSRWKIRFINDPGFMRASVKNEMDRKAKLALSAKLKGLAAGTKKSPPAKSQRTASSGATGDEADPWDLEG